MQQFGRVTMRLSFQLVLVFATVACTLLLVTRAAAAQEGLATPPAASPLLPPDHWAVLAARRAEALGLLDSYLPAQRAVPRLVVGAALRDASERAAGRSRELHELLLSWQERFREEFPEVAMLVAGDEPSGPLRGSSAYAGYTNHLGRDAPGLGEHPPTVTGASPLPDLSGALAGASLAVAAGRRLALLVEPQLGPERVTLAGADLVSLWGPISVSLGRQPVGYGYSVGGGVVLSGAVAFDRLQIESTRALRLPGTLGGIGPVSFNTFLARINEERHQGDPFFWGASVTWRPHPRFNLSVNRATPIGGGLAPEPITAEGLFLSFFGKHVAHLTNQVVAAEFRYRLPTERLVPLTAYLEWGAEDSAGAFYNVPGQIFGLYLPALPAVPQVAAGVEYARFAPSCCGNPTWYRHVAHDGNWVLADRPLAHGLGGHGEEWMLYGQAALLGARLDLDGRIVRRERLRENLFVPGREGRSTGFAGRATWRLTPRVDAQLLLSRESGSGWTEQALQTGARVFF